MEYKVNQKRDNQYIEADATTPLSTERDALDLIAACMEHDTHLLMLRTEGLSADFFTLQTGLAGQALQKFANYRIKVAVVMPSEQRISGKFKELLTESSKGNDFRAFKTTIEAENWLLNIE